MSELLDALIAQRKQEALDYKKYLAELVELTQAIKNPNIGESYPTMLDTSAKRALYDNLDKNEALALAVDSAVRGSLQDDWRGNAFKIKKVRLAIGRVLNDDTTLVERILELVKNQHDY